MRMPAARVFNEVVQVDANHLRGRRILHVVDVATKFHVAIQVNAETTREIFQALRQGCLTWAGPMKVLVHPVTGMTSQEMTGEVEARGVPVETRSAEASWQTGL